MFIEDGRPAGMDASLTRFAVGVRIRIRGRVAEWLRQGPAKPCTRVRFPPPPRAISSVGERYLDTVEVAGSIPASRTTILAVHSPYRCSTPIGADCCLGALPRNEVTDDDVGGPAVFRVLIRAGLISGAKRNLHKCEERRRWLHREGAATAGRRPAAAVPAVPERVATYRRPGRAAGTAHSQARSA